ncbi:hypothetical protein CFR74_02930 [Novacetimonas hansenii]|nr:hypothetical protein CFR74_02930 [Novacetimonas hansenii]RFO99840.1 hypothetical protein BGC30_13990 [Novacetimonas hansenii]
MTIVLFHHARPPRRRAGLFFAHPDGKQTQLPQNIPQVKPMAPLTHPAPPDGTARSDSRP